MGKVNLPMLAEGKKNGLHWAKKVAFGAKPTKKFSVIEGKRVLKMLEEKGLKPLALEVGPDGGFRFEVAPLVASATEVVQNPWDKVL